MAWVFFAVLQLVFVIHGIRQDERAGLWSWSKFFFALGFAALEVVIFVVPLTFATRTARTPATFPSSSPSHLSLQVSTSSGSSSSVAAGSSLTAKPASRLTATTTPNNPNFLKDRLSHRNGPSYHL